MMKKSDFKIKIALLSLIMALAIFLVGFTLYNKLSIVEPIISEISSIEAVKEVEVNKEKDYLIEVGLLKVNNFAQVYSDIKDILDSKLNGKAYELVIKDKPNLLLNESYTSLQPALYQALANHEYVWLNEKLAEIAEVKGISYAFFLDDNYLFIQLIDEENYIYKAIKHNKDL
ncbi:MAG: hypothetical protein GX333_08010 [Syntrophomonadaceae bacterium]|nr:hypothetical protein [Syntrophomonadaceae bacterium]